MIETDLNALGQEIRADIDPSSGDFVGYFRENISLYSRHYTNLSFDNGIIYTDVTFNTTDTINGTTFRQTKDTAQDDCDKGQEYPRFTLDESGDCEPDPTIVSDATEITQFNLTVEGDGGPSSSPRTDIVVTNGADTWRLVMAKQSNKSILIEVDGTGTNLGVVDTPFELELQEDGQLSLIGAGEVTFAEGVSRPYDIKFENTPPSGGNALTGTYTLVTNGNENTGIDSQPETSSTTVSPAVDIYYQRRDVTYNRTVILNQTGAR
jgi:hypothetical protein